MFLLLTQGLLQYMYNNIAWILGHLPSILMYLVIITLSPSKHKPPYIPKQKHCTSDWLRIRFKALVNCCVEKITAPILNMKTKRRKRGRTSQLHNQHQVNPRRCIPTRLNASKRAISRNHLLSYSAPTSGDSEANPYDSDSYLILVDNCCSACVTNDINDFEGEPVKVNARVKGVGGAIKLSHKGTIKWSFQDNEGRSHTF